MKKILSIVAILALFVGVGCTENFGEDKKGDTTFTLEQLEVNATAEGGTVEVNYSIENPQSGAVVLTECNDGWIKNLNTTSSSSININISLNFIAYSISK